MVLLNARALARVVFVVLGFWAMALAFAAPALAGPALTFTDGWIGQTSNNNSISNAVAFRGGTPALTIRSVTISQDLGSSSFQIQGNDIPVTITAIFTDGSRQSATGSITWRETNGSTLRGIGILFDSGQNINDGYSVSAGEKTYLLKVAGSNLSISNGGSTSGNAALNQLLDAMNGLLGSVSNFTISKTAPASVSEGGAVAYTIGIGNSGGGASGTSVTVQDVLPSGMTYNSATRGTGVSSVSCSSSGQTLTCSVALSSNLAGNAANGSASFVINATAPSSGASITNYASVDPNGGNSPPPAVDCSLPICASATTSLTGAGVISGEYLRSNGTAVSGATVNLLDQNDTVLRSTTTNASGYYQFTSLSSGTYGIRFVSSGSNKAKAKAGTGNQNGEYIRNLTIASGSQINDADAVVVDPAGVIYDSNTRQPVAGATVKFLFNNQLVPNTWLDQTLGGANTQVTAADGQYSFVLNGNASDGVYTIEVVTPSGYTFESTAIPATTGPYDPGLGGGIVEIQPQATAPAGAASTTYYLSFQFVIGATASTTSNGVIHNHIPIDPQASPATTTITANPTSIAANGTTTSTITVQLKDAGGNNLDASKNSGV